MMKDSMRRRAEGWLKIEYNAGYAKKVFDPSAVKKIRPLPLAPMHPEAARTAPGRAVR